MKSGWEIKEIGELCQVVNGGTPKTKIPEYWGSDHCWITPKDMGKLTSVYVGETERQISALGLEKSSAKLLPANSVILSSRAPIGHLAINTVEMATNQGCKGIIPGEEIIPEYLYYFLRLSKKMLNDLGGGAVFPELSGKKLKSVQIPLPPLPEQERIVAVLDEAFAAIDQAIANTQRNLANAQELFESYLSQIDCESSELGDLINIATGKLNANAAVEGGQYPFFTCSKETFAIDTFAFDTEAILLAGNNAVGDFNVKHYSGKFNAYQRTYVLTVKDANAILYRYLYYQVLDKLRKFKQQSVGAATKFLKLSIIREMEIPLPTLSQQKEIVRNLDSLNSSTEQLGHLYQQKLQSLQELKQSLLQKAFSGEL